MADDHGSVNFGTLVEHYCDAFPGHVRKGADAEHEARKADFRTMLKKFEEKHGTIKSQSWWPNLRAAAVLTDHDEYFAAGNPFDAKIDLKLAGQLSEIDRLARRVRDLLDGAMRRNSLELIFSIWAAALESIDQLREIDSERKPEEAKELREFIEIRTETDLKLATDYAEGAIRRRAQLFYLGGMGAGVLVVMVVVGLLRWVFGRADVISDTELVPTALLLGALGAVVSVMQRLTQGRLRTSLDSGLIAGFLLGTFRPAIGAVFGFVIVALILGGLIPLEVPTDDKRVFFLGGLAFLAGFSERFAQDMIGTAKGVGATATITATASAETTTASTEPGAAPVETGTLPPEPAAAAAEPATT